MWIKQLKVEITGSPVFTYLKGIACKHVNLAPKIEF